MGYYFIWGCRCERKTFINLKASKYLCVKVEDTRFKIIESKIISTDNIVVIAIWASLNKIILFQ